MKKMVEEKSLFTSYILWLSLGWFGVHHVYLKRDNQAFVWWSTLGGLFWLGWARDFWRIPEYVDEANKEEYFMQELKRKMKLRSSPPFNTTRFSGEVFIGSFYGTLVRLACPNETPSLVLALVTSLGMNAGVYIVGNIGREKGRFFVPYIATLATYLALFLISGDEPGYVNCCLASAITFNYFREWRKDEIKKSGLERAAYFFTGAMVIFALWGSFFYFNATITYQNGEKIKLTDSITHFFKSPLWLDFKGTFWSLYREGESKEWKHFYDDVVHSFDPTGERNARTVLGITSSANEEDIRKAYKKLVVKWHPDRYRGEDRYHAQQRFIEIQQAYELLQQRIKKNSRAFNRSYRTHTEF